jgi:hypothetical protein
MVSTKGFFDNVLATTLNQTSSLKKMSERVAATSVSEVLKGVAAIKSEAKQVDNVYEESNDFVQVEDFDFVKATVNEIAENYLELFKLDVHKFYDLFIGERAIVIMACLMNNKLHKVLMDDEIIKNKLSGLFYNSNLEEQLSVHLKEYKGNTEGMWKYLGEKDKEYLIVNISSGSCRAGEQQYLDKDYSSEELNGEFKIVKGLLFKSTADHQFIKYMEV